MKKILITGSNSYIGTSFEKYINEKYSQNYKIDTLSLRNSNWTALDFSVYDTIFHVVGIAHADIGNVSEDRKKMYYKINTDLAYDTAKKAKLDGVKQFIYMSSIIVYGNSAPLGKHKIITKETKPTPANFYGDSKLQADLKLQTLDSDIFKVCIIRAPMIYGKGSKGNYQLLLKIARKLPVFPNIINERSVLYIENLCIYVKEYIDHQLSGIQFPQNNEYISTSEMVKAIACANNKTIHVISLLNIFVYLASKIPGKPRKMIDKAFGNLVYEKTMVNEKLISTDESIRKTEFI